jgi:hypothetical protein
MKVVRVKILGKVENLVCRILLILSTVIKIAFDVHDERGKSARILVISFKPLTGSWGLILGQSARFGSLSTPVDTAWVGFAACAVLLGVRTVLSDTLGGDASLFDGVALRLVDNISVKASIAAFNLLPVLRNGFAAAGFFSASVNSPKAADALSADAVVGMLYFSGKKTTVSETLVPLVFGMKNSQC